MTATRSIRLDIALAAALLLWLTQVVYHQWDPDTYLTRDGAFYATMSRSIATALTLEQTEFQPLSWYNGDNPRYHGVDQAWSNVSVGWDGRWWPKHSYLMPVVATPFYIVMGNPGLLVFNVLQCLVLLLLCYKIGEHFFGPGTSALAVLLVSASPIIIESAYRFSHDVFSGMLVAGCALALLRSRFALAGLLCGLSLWAKVTVAPIVGPLALATLVTRRQLKAAWLPFAVGTAVPLATYAAANWYMFGAPWVTSYQSILVATDSGMAIESAAEAFDVPLKEGVRQLLGKGWGGMLAMMPMAFVGAAGLFTLVRRAPLWLAAGIIALASYPLIFGTYRWPHTRFFLPWFPIVVVGLAGLLSVPARALPALASKLPSLPATARRHAPWVAAALVAIACLIAIAARSEPPRLSARLTSARVYLGAVPCDYYNPQQERWECSRLDTDGWHMTGVPHSGECRFAQESGERLIWAHPHPSQQPRRLIWSDLPHGIEATFLVGIDQESQPLAANVELWINRRQVAVYQPDRPGELERHVLDSAQFSEVSNEVEVKVMPPPHDRHVCFDLRWRE